MSGTPGWAAGPTTIIYGKSGDAETSDRPTGTAGRTRIPRSDMFHHCLNTSLVANPGWC